MGPKNNAVSRDAAPVECRGGLCCGLLEDNLCTDLDLAGGEGRANQAELGAIGILAVEDTQVIQSSGRWLAAYVEIRAIETVEEVEAELQARPFRDRDRKALANPYVQRRVPGSTDGGHSERPGLQQTGILEELGIASPFRCDEGGVEESHPALRVAERSGSPLKLFDIDPLKMNGVGQASGTASIDGPSSGDDVYRLARTDPEKSAEIPSADDSVQNAAGVHPFAPLTDGYLPHPVGIVSVGDVVIGTHDLKMRLGVIEEPPEIGLGAGKIRQHLAPGIVELAGETRSETPSDLELESIVLGERVVAD